MKTPGKADTIQKSIRSQRVHPKPQNSIMEQTILDKLLLSSVARQLMSADEVEIERKRLAIRRASRQGLRTVTFNMARREYAAMEHASMPDQGKEGTNVSS